jgi:hypothetical protein
MQSAWLMNHPRKGTREPSLLLMDRQIQQMGSGSGDPLRASVV